MQKIENFQDSSDRHEGWRYLIDKTDLKAGTDPTKATLYRQAELEKRESKALQVTEIGRDETRFPGKQIREQLCKASTRNT